jgi:hypothetical protein
MSSFSALFDEYHDPPLRHTLGRLLTCARTADIALTHLRLAGLDLSPSEAGGLERCRVMLGQLDADVLFDAGASLDVARERLRLLTAFAQSGRLQIRTAPHHVWNPDFSVFAGLPADRAAALVGAHYFGRPYPRFGIALTCVLTSRAAVRACRERFEQLWADGYDVLPVVVETLQRLGE